MSQNVTKSQKVYKKSHKTMTDLFFRIVMYIWGKLSEWKKQVGLGTLLYTSIVDWMKAERGEF